MRSKAGVGITPPKVPATPYPASSVIINKTFGAPVGGTILGFQYGLESFAFGLISPLKLGAGFGTIF